MAGILNSKMNWFFNFPVPVPGATGRLKMIISTYYLVAKPVWGPYQAPYQQGSPGDMVENLRNPMPLICLPVTELSIQLRSRMAGTFMQA